MSLGLGRAWIALAGWVAGAAAATAVGLFALSAIDLGPTNRTSRPQLVETVIDLTSSPSVPPQEPPGPAGQDNPVERVLSAVGGSIVARCSATGAYLVSWSPAQGYKAEAVRRGPATVTKVEFEHHDGGRSISTVRCVDGMPQLTMSRDGD